MILCLGTTPAAQRVMVFRQLSLDKVNRAAQTLDGIAGKSINVAKVLHALGERPLATGFLGGPRGEQIAQDLTARGIASAFLTVTTPTRQCVTVIDQSTGAITELVEESQPVDRAAYDQLLKMVEEKLPNCRAVVMSGTIASGGPPDLYLTCARWAQAAGILTIVDASGEALRQALAARPGLVKPNRAELEATFGRELREERALLEAMLELHKLGAQRVVVTAGADPTLASDGQQKWRITAPKIAAVNPIGSGDSFTAGVTWQLLRSRNLGEACRWGAAAGAANALTLMAGELELREVETLAAQVRVEEI